MIIPVYNRTEFIGEALASLVRQTHASLEVILINDGSGPAVNTFLLSICENYPFVQMLELDEHRGVASARNQGLEIASGSFVLFLDDDDLLEPGMIEKCLLEFEKDPEADVVIADAEVFTEEPETKRYRDQQKVFQRVSSTYRRRPVTDPGYFLIYAPPIHAMLFRKAVLAGRRFAEDLPYGEDRYLWMQLRDEGVKFRVADFQGARYRLRTAGGSHRTQLQIRFFEKLRRSGMLRTSFEKNYVNVCLLFLSATSGRPGKTAVHLLKALASPVLSVKIGGMLGRWRW